MTDFIHDPEEKIKHMREIRLRVGWTQEDMADSLGTDRFRIINWESGKEKPGHKFMIPLLRLLDELQRQAIQAEEQGDE